MTAELNAPETIQLRFCRSCERIDLHHANCSRCNYPYETQDAVGYLRLDTDVWNVVADAGARITELEQQIGQLQRELGIANQLFKNQKEFADDMVKINRGLFAHSQEIAAKTREIALRFRRRLVIETHEHAVNAFRLAAVAAIKALRSETWVGSFYKPYFIHAVQSVRMPPEEVDD